jgi:hypothetical protein
MPEGFGGLIPYYEEFVPEHFPLPNGKARGKRSAQQIAKEFNLPLIRVKQLTFIDPVLAAQRLREVAMTPSRETPRRRGRPRKYKYPAAGVEALAEKRRLAKIAQSAEDAPL